MEDFRLDTIESYTSTVKAARRVLKEYKKKHIKEIDTWRLRVGKTIYFFNSYKKLKAKLTELDILLDVIKYDMAKPGEPLPPKKLKL